MYRASTDGSQRRNCSKYGGNVFGDIFHCGFCTAVEESPDDPWEAIEVADEALAGPGWLCMCRRVCPVDTTLNLAHEGWIQHEKKSDRPAHNNLKRGKERPRARGEHTRDIGYILPQTR